MSFTLRERKNLILRDRNETNKSRNSAGRSNSGTFIKDDVRGSGEFTLSYTYSRATYAYFNRTDDRQTHGVRSTKRYRDVHFYAHGKSVCASVFRKYRTFRLFTLLRRPETSVGSVLRRTQLYLSELIKRPFPSNISYFLTIERSV